VRSRGRRLFVHSQWLAVLLVIALGLLCFPGVASAAETTTVTTTVTISTPTEPIESGEQFSVSITVVPGTAIAGMQFDLHFDPSLVTVDDIKEGDLLIQGGASTLFNSGNIDSQAGTIRGAFGAITSPGETVSTQGTFATIILTARKQSGSCPLSLSSVIVGDIDGNPVPVSLGNEGTPGIAAERPVFQWWVLSVIFGAALVLIVATIAGVLFRRRQMVKALEGARRQDRGA
jgi:hypothetical protein